MASLVGIKGAEPRRLLRSLEALLPDVLWLLQQQEREFKKKLLAELPRRTSDRIAIKAAQKDEQVSSCWHALSAYWSLPQESMASPVHSDSVAGFPLQGAGVCVAVCSSL